MTAQEVFELVIQRFDQLGIAYMLCGSLGAMAYGEPRYTNDVDLVILLPPSKVEEFCHAFPIAEFYCPPQEVIMAELRRRGQFNLLHHESGIKVDCIFTKNDSFGREEFARRRARSFTATVTASIASPEDVILGKLRYFKMGGSEKHLSDIRGMLRVSGDEIDFDYLERWVKELGLAEPWRLVRPS